MNSKFGNNIYYLPAPLIDHWADNQGPHQASQREHGDGAGPQEQQRSLVHVRSIPLKVRLVVKRLEDLKDRAPSAAQATVPLTERRPKCS